MITSVQVFNGTESVSGTASAGTYSRMHVHLRFATQCLLRDYVHIVGVAVEGPGGPRGPDVGGSASLLSEWMSVRVLGEDMVGGNCISRFRFTKRSIGHDCFHAGDVL